jgi:lysyl-tRNA synthetase class 2
MTDDWRPTASLANLRGRADLLARIRAFFAARGVLEVETPVLSAGATTDPQIESLSTGVRGLASRCFLATSPEFAMKRLLAAGIGDIFQICKVFRDGERGRWHNPEFTLVEWYRLGVDDAGLMDEVEALLRHVLEPERRLAPALHLTYADALERYAGIDSAHASDADLDAAARRHGIDCAATLDREARLDLLMGMVVGPKLGIAQPTFLCDYPASQASLARLKAGPPPGSPPVAARFELYLDGIELANGFHELSAADEQRARFAADLGTRRAHGRAEPPVDRRLLAALEAGLPDCAGVALGFDRLAALALRAGSLAEVIAFPIERA